MIKKVLLFLVVASMLPSFVSNTKEVAHESKNPGNPEYSDLLKAKPGMISGNYSYTVVDSISFNPGDVSYYDISDSTTQSIAYGYGVSDGGINKALYLETPGGGFDTKMRLRTYTGNDLSSANGFMYYVDLSEIKAEKGNYIGLGIGLIMMDSAIEPPTSSYLWQEELYGGHFNHYYPLKNKSAYYFDLQEGRFVSTSIIEKCVVLKEGYEGWVYVPFSSYGWNANTESKYVMTKDAFDNGYKWLNYTHIITKNFKSDDAQSKIYIDEYNFVKKQSLVSPNYVYQYDLDPTCYEIGGSIYQEETTSTLKLVSPVEKLNHSYQYLKYKDGAIGVCSHCGDLIYTEDTSIVNSA